VGGRSPGSVRDGHEALLDTRSKRRRAFRFVQVLARTSKSREQGNPRVSTLPKLIERRRGHTIAWRNDFSRFECLARRGTNVQVEFLGHAGISIESGRTKLIMDGWFSREGGFDAAWYQLPANHYQGDSNWSDIDAVIVSHEHLDHLDSQFLRSLPASVPFYIPSYGSPLFGRKLLRMTGRSPNVLVPGREHQIGDVRLRIWTEVSPMNHDSVWVFRHGEHSIVHMVDSRLSTDQLDEILNYLGSEPDVLLVQCSGASWFPLVYENYDETTKYARGLRKREQKLSYALAVEGQRLQGAP
jgi:L-ascorbate metabolism protein UlaG (beta-lactamase superfamily)